MWSNTLRARLEPVLRRLLHTYWRFSRGATLGARAAVFDSEGRVFLVKHSYVAGWHFPGGGVENGESFLSALVRELREEGNLEMTGPPRLHGIFFNAQASPRDHVALYVVKEFRQIAPPRRTAEIVDHGFFAAGDLPPGTTRATRARLAEILSGTLPAETW